MLLAMQMLHFTFPKTYIDFLTPFKMVTLDFSFLGSISVLNTLK